MFFCNFETEKLASDSVPNPGLSGCSDSSDISIVSGIGSFLCDFCLGVLCWDFGILRGERGRPAVLLANFLASSRVAPAGRVLREGEWKPFLTFFIVVGVLGIWFVGVCSWGRFITSLVLVEPSSLTGEGSVCSGRSIVGSLGSDFDVFSVLWSSFLVSGLCVVDVLCAFSSGFFLGDGGIFVVSCAFLLGVSLGVGAAALIASSLGILLGEGSGISGGDIFSEVWLLGFGEGLHLVVS